MERTKGGEIKGENGGTSGCVDEREKERHILIDIKK